MNDEYPHKNDRIIMSKYNTEKFAFSSISYLVFMAKKCLQKISGFKVATTSDAFLQKLLIESILPR